MPSQLRALVLGALLLTLAAAPAAGQTGRIVGRVLDGATGQALSGAQVFVPGTGLGVLSGLDGRYLLLNVPAGPRSVRVTFIGYAEKTVEGIQVAPGQTVQQDVTLATAAVALEEITVSAARETGTVAAAINEQRTAVGVMSATTLEQIARSPDSDAAQAVQRVSGVTVRDGKYLFVRGLGERYTTTSLNGSRLPSPEPEKKVVPLDLFPSSLLEAITTSKTFTPDQPGDFSGAQVNLRTRSFPAERMMQLSISGGVNSELSTTLPLPVFTGSEWMGAAAANRGLSQELLDVPDFTRLSQAEVNGLIRGLPRTWSLTRGDGHPNVSGSLSFGGEDPLFGHAFGYVGSLSYSRSQDIRIGEVHARAIAGDAQGTPVAQNVFEGSTGQTGVLVGGLINLSTYLGRGTKIELNNTYDRTADNTAHIDWGRLEEFPQIDTVQRTSLSYVERTVRSHQLRGEHQLGRSRVDWSLTDSRVSRTEPDRADLAYGRELAPSGQLLPLAWLGFISEAAKRTSSDLAEEVRSGDLSYGLTLGEGAGALSLKVGGGYRATTRDAFTASYNLRAQGLSPEQRVGSPEELFYGSFTEGSTARIALEPNSAGGSYAATDEVRAAFLMGELPLGARLRVIGGARLESWILDMDVEPTARGLMRIRRENTDVLPSLALNVELAENQTLRLSASQTLARPEYRELAPVSYRDMLGDREVFGDSSLTRTLVQNFDARWEWYPQLDEVVSIGFFGKRFDAPIESIDVATSGASQLSFINAESATNYGVELEFRKGLGFMAMPAFGVFANATLMRSRINTSNSLLSALTNSERPMVGQSPYVVNTGLTYANFSGDVSATLLYNVVGERITAAAVNPIKVDTYERPRQLLDFSARFPVFRGVSGKVDAKNLLDSAVEERQGDVVRLRYTSGRSFSFGLSAKLQ